MQDFPFFRTTSLIYLDNAATMQKPQAVIDAMNDFYEHANAPVHRGVYSLAERATEKYEHARSTVAQFIGAFDDEIIFTKGTTEGINYIASSWPLQPGDEIIITELEHHSNILPWMRLERRGIVLKYIPILPDGTLDYEVYSTLLSSRTKLVACTHTSNVLSTPVDLNLIIKHAHDQGARVLVDAAQAVGRSPVLVHDLQVDFLVFSAHKLGGPTGCGVLYIARHMQPEVEPYQVGGGMVYSVDYHEAKWLEAPRKFEAGTPAVAQVIGLEAALTFIKEHNSFEGIKQHEAALCAQLIAGLRDLPIRILGNEAELVVSGHMVSFVHETVHAHDVAAYLDSKEICVRAGNHCAQILHKKLGIESSIRASFASYTSQADIEALCKALASLPSW